MSIGDRQVPHETNDGNPSSTSPVVPSASPDGWSHRISPPRASTGLLLLIIAVLAGAMWNMSSKVTRLETQLANIPKVNEPRIRRDITGIVQRLSALEAEKNDTEAEAVNHANPYDASEIAALQSSVTSLGDRMNVAEATITKQSREIADLNRRARAIYESIASMKTRINKQLAAATSPRVNAGVKNGPPEGIPCQFWPW